MHAKIFSLQYNGILRGEHVSIYMAEFFAERETVQTRGLYIYEYIEQAQYIRLYIQSAFCTKMGSTQHFCVASTAKL